MPLITERDRKQAANVGMLVAGISIVGAGVTIYPKILPIDKVFKGASFVGKKVFGTAQKYLKDPELLKATGESLISKLGIAGGVMKSMATSGMGKIALGTLAAAGTLYGVAQAGTMTTTYGEDKTRNEGLPHSGLLLGGLGLAAVVGGYKLGLNRLAKMGMGALKVIKHPTTPMVTIPLIAGGVGVYSVLSTTKKMRTQGHPLNPEYYDIRERNSLTQDEYLNSVQGMNYNTSVGSMYSDVQLTSGLVQSLYEGR